MLRDHLQRPIVPWWAGFVCCLALAAGCKGITQSPGRPDADLPRDTRNCSTQVKYCTCYCAVRCGDTCVQEVCYDPCPPDGGYNRDGNFPEERHPDGASGDAERPRDIPVVRDVEEETDSDPPTLDTGPRDTSPDVGVDSGPSIPDATDTSTGDLDTGVGH